MSLNAWRTYLAERFPVPVTLMLALATGAASYAVVQTPIVRAGFDLTIDASQLGGCVALMFLLLFHLRVFDEHKDFAQDAATRPDRAVQRGVVTLDQLKVAGALTIALELVIAFAPGARAGAWWLLPLGYSVLMLFEFFVPHWLERHFGIYAVSHSAITALVCVALVMRFAVPGFVPTPELLGLAVLALASTFSIDVLRKTWMPASEIDGVASWSKLVGVSRAAWLGSFLIALAGACAAWLGWRLGGRWGWIGFVAAVTGWGVATIRGFAAKPTAKGEKMLQVVAGIHYLVVWTGIAVVAAIANGARWYL